MKKSSFLQSCALFVFITFSSACNPSSAILSSERPLFEESVSALNDSASSLKDSDIWDVSLENLSSIDNNRKLIALTFDDAPSKTMENILALFADYNEKNPDCMAFATFFFNGMLLNNENIHLLHTAHAMGFELGNHTHSHKNLNTLSAEELTWEIEQTDALLQEIDGKPRHLLRAPFGKANQNVQAIVETPIINWSIDTLDWDKRSEEDIYHAVFDQKFSGAIVLMHDGYENTISALKRLLPDLKTAGYQVVTISQLSKSHNCPLYRGKTYIRARKQ